MKRQDPVLALKKRFLPWLKDLIYTPRARLSVLLGLTALFATLYWEHGLDAYTPTASVVKAYTNFIVSIDSGIEVIALQKLSNPVMDYFFTYFYLFAEFISVLTFFLLIEHRKWNSTIRMCLCALLALVPAIIAPFFFPVASPRFAVIGVISIRNEVLPSSESMIPSGFLYASFPSLHVVDATYCLLCVASSKIKKAFVYLWEAILLLVAFSVIFLGEHYMVDVLSGLAIGATIWMIAGKLQHTYLLFSD